MERTVKKKTTFSLMPETCEKLRYLATMTGLTQSQIIDQAIRKTTWDRKDK